ncbi:DndE family protein [Salinibius halmophilus]|uniref:DndE family protein n=1 Tax=Salinibius halmophilus TaxID=1853216 RepID=UPI003899E1FD
MCLDRGTEEKLKRYKQTTGISPNAASRLAFFQSIESGFTYEPGDTTVSSDGQMVLDKVTWFGSCLQTIELILVQKYPNLPGELLASAWAAHVKNGFGSIAR